MVDGSSKSEGRKSELRAILGSMPLDLLKGEILLVALLRLRVGELFEDF